MWYWKSGTGCPDNTRVVDNLESACFLLSEKWEETSCVLGADRWRAGEAGFYDEERFLALLQFASECVHHEIQFVCADWIDCRVAEFSDAAGRGEGLGGLRLVK